MPGFSELTTPEATIIIQVDGDELQIVSSSLSGDQFTVTFIAEEGASYKVTQSATLNGAFTDVADATVDDAQAQESVTFTVPATDKFFFRIEKTN